MNQVFLKKNENKKLSDFEKMLEGFAECKFNGMYVDYNTHEPKNDFFIKRNAKPIKQSSDTGLVFKKWERQSEVVEIYGSLRQH